ncbi:MAG: glucose-1-phosphate cytidylyltransferase [Parvibaculales bacterium]
MQAVIFAGGYGTRISEETMYRPKPMVEIGGKPILWHILKIYSLHGIHDFVILSGYKSEYIKNYFTQYIYNQNDITVDLSANSVEIHSKITDPWKITILDTGEDTMTGGRLKRAANFLEDQFCLTYGDAVADIDISAKIAFHAQNEGLVTLTAVQPQARYGALTISGSQVTSFREKPSSEENFINGGFFVCDKGVLDYIDGNETILERGPLENMASDGQLFCYHHAGFWAAMDNVRDKQHLESLWSSGNAPWKKW